MIQHLPPTETVMGNGSKKAQGFNVNHLIFDSNFSIYREEFNYLSRIARKHKRPLEDIFVGIAIHMLKADMRARGVALPTKGKEVTKAHLWVKIEIPKTRQKAPKTRRSRQGATRPRPRG